MEMFLFCALTELGEVCEAKRTRTVACELARARAYGNERLVVPFASALSQKLYTVQFWACVLLRHSALKI